MLLKYQTLSQQYHLEYHHSFCNKTKYTANQRTVFQYFIWKTAKTNVCSIHGIIQHKFNILLLLCNALQIIQCS